jgi:hypothetical protein
MKMSSQLEIADCITTGSMEDEWEKAITAVKQKYNIKINLKEVQKEILHH